MVRKWQIFNNNHNQAAARRRRRRSNIKSSRKKRVVNYRYHHPTEKSEQILKRNRYKIVSDSMCLHHFTTCLRFCLFFSTSVFFVRLSFGFSIAGHFQLYKLKHDIQLQQHSTTHIIESLGRVALCSYKVANILMITTTIDNPRLYDGKDIPNMSIESVLYICFQFWYDIYRFGPFKCRHTKCNQCILNVHTIKANTHAHTYWN